jgi:hypothetical protein
VTSDEEEEEEDEQELDQVIFQFYYLRYQMFKSQQIHLHIFHIILKYQKFNSKSIQLISGGESWRRGREGERVEQASQWETEKEIGFRQPEGKRQEVGQEREEESRRQVMTNRSVETFTRPSLNRQEIIDKVVSTVRKESTYVF